jgi:hypothetical protein
MLGLARCPRLCLSHPRSMPPAARLTATPLNGSVAHLPQALPPEHHGSSNSDEWWAGLDSNQGPWGYEPPALTG